MVKIITKKVEMPSLELRRFQLKPLDLNGKKWTVTDNGEQMNSKGSYENMAIITHNLNKKFYLI